MKLAVLMKAQAWSKRFAQPQAGQTPSRDTSATSTMQTAEGKRFPAGLGSKEYWWWMGQGRTPRDVAVHNTVPWQFLTVNALPGSAAPEHVGM